MAKNVKIDPAFQAAPYLGDSSHDPIEFTRRQSMIKYQAKKQREAEIERNIAKGLDQLTIDLKGWDDKEGFAEIQARQDKAYKMYMDLATKGVNFVTPKTTADVMSFKALTDFQTETKQLADIRNNHKGLLDLVEKAVKEDSLKPEEEQRIDQDSTRANMAIALKDNTLIGRDKLMNNLLVPKVQVGDVVKQVIADKGFYIPPTQTQVVTPNPETGTNDISFTEDMPKADVDENVRRAGVRYAGLTEAMKKGVKQMRDAETNDLLRVMPLKDYYATLAVPTYRKKFLEKTTGAGGGLGINLFGQKITTQPAIKNSNTIRLGDRDYTEHYDFNISKPIIGISMSNLGAEVYEGEKWVPASKEGGLVTAQLNFYDPKTNSFIFTSTASGMEAGVWKAQTFSVPRENLGKEVDNLPIIKEDGKQGKLRDIYGQLSEGTKKLKLPGDFWSKPSKPSLPKTK